MINSTGTQGYFQRAIAAHMIPEVPVISASPMINFTECGGGTRYDLQVLEIEDKAANTESVLRESGLNSDRLLIIGDSGGDGPHFRWGAKVGAHLIGSMTKASLAGYCKANDLSISTLFGVSYAGGEKRNLDDELRVDFMGLTEVIRAATGIG